MLIEERNINYPVSTTIRQLILIRERDINCPVKVKVKVKVKQFHYRPGQSQVAGS
jgi:hypothetical protein